MFKRFVSFLALVLIAICPARAQGASEADMPVAPLPTIEYRGWSNALVLRNPHLEVTVVPAVGRILEIRYKGGENLLRFDASMQGVLPDPDGGGTWLNVGGDWLWPVAQSRWAAWAGADWPPPKALAEAEWTGTAWKDADGAQSCLLTREYGEPLHIRVSRLIKLDKETARIGIRQRIERLAESSVPVTLWNVTQMDGVGNVVLPVDADSAFDSGLRPLMFDLPDAGSWTRCEEAVVIATTAGEHKLCSDSKRGWIAALKGDVLVIEQARGGPGDGLYPDGGCTVELYSNAGLGYAEIETLSVEVLLAAGESLQNTLTMDFVPAGADRSDCALARQVRHALGEGGNKSEIQTKLLRAQPVANDGRGRIVGSELKEFPVMEP